MSHSLFNSSTQKEGETFHTVRFDWFLSGLEWIINLEFSLLKLLIFYQKSLHNIRSRLNFSTFWVFESVFRYICAKSFKFDQAYLNRGLKTQNVEKLSLDLMFHNNFWWNIKSFSEQNSKLRIHSKPDRNQSKLIVCIANGVSSVWLCKIWAHYWHPWRKPHWTLDALYISWKYFGPT